MTRQKYTITDRCQWQMKYHRKRGRLSPIRQGRCPVEASITVNGKRYCQVHAQYVSPERPD